MKGNVKVSVDTGSKYRKKICVQDDEGREFITEIDVYDVLKAFGICNPATQHAIKKLLGNGSRGHKDLITDLEEARWSITRAIELEGH